MLYRYAGEPDGAADLSAYTDAGSVSAYAEKAVQWCVKNGILTGKTSSTLAPEATAIRAECAAMLQRFASLTKSKKEHRRIFLRCCFCPSNHTQVYAER